MDDSTVEFLVRTNRSHTNGFDSWHQDVVVYPIKIDRSPRRSRFVAKWHDYETEILHNRFADGNDFNSACPPIRHDTTA